MNGHSTNLFDTTRIKKITFRIFDASVWLCVAAGLLWSFGAVFFLPLLPTAIAKLLAFAYLASVFAVGLWLRKGNVFRAVVAGSTLAILFGTLLIQPSNDRNWDADHAKIAAVSVSDGQVEITNFRHNRYRSELDYDASYRTKRFELERLSAVWFIVQRFADFDGMAHVFLSFELAPNSIEATAAPEYFSLSIEIRREVGEVYDPIRGLYRCYEIAHVIGDERDLIGVRTVHRPEDRVYLYRVNATPEQTQALFLRFADRIALLQQKPEFYHSLLNNCANGITRQAYRLTPEPINWLDYRVVFPGYSGDLAFNKGMFSNPGQAETFKAFECQSRIDQVAREYGIGENFSSDIRRRLPLGQ